MEYLKKCARNLLLPVFILAVSFGISLVIQTIFHTDTLIPTIFVLAVFLIAMTAEGYVLPIIASLFSVLAVTFAFTFPYFTFNFSVPESIFSAVIMLIITILTSTLTTKVKKEKKIRAESEKERMRANLLRAVSHDLRTPLTTIYGASSALMENYDDLSRDQQKELLKEMKEDSEWLIRMVENLLSITKIGDENVKIVKMPTVIEELLDTVLVKFSKRYPETEVAIEMSEEFITVPMDAMLIEQVFLNLLENAVQHAQGMTELLIRVKLEGEKAVFSIADNGCGIPKEQINDLFTGYLDRKGTRADCKKSNMGIGLSVCAAIVKAHGGSTTAANRENGGAEFRFDLSMEG